MLTNFSSVFDGFELVVFADDWSELKRIHYTHHQSPFARDRPLPVPAGSSTQTLVIPVPNWTHSKSEIRLQLVGGLRGTAWPSGLISNDLTLTLPPPGE